MSCTNTGLKYLFEASRFLLPGTLSYQTVEGDLLRGIKVRNLSYLGDAFEVQINEGFVLISPSSLYSGSLLIHRLEVSHLSITEKASPVSTPQTHSRETRIPSIQVTFFDINTLEYQSHDNQTHIQKAEGTLAVSNQHFLISFSQAIGQYNNIPILGGVFLEASLSKGLTIENSWLKWGKESYTLSHSPNKPSTIYLTAHHNHKQYLIETTYLSDGSWSIHSQFSLFSNHHPIHQVQLNLQNEPFSKTLNLNFLATDKEKSNNQIKGHLSFSPETDNQPLTDWYISGVIDAVSTDLQPWLRLFPDLVVKKSQVNGKIQISGKLGAPFITTELKGEDLEFSLPQYQSSYRIQNLKTHGNALGNFYLVAEGEVLSGSGNFKITGSANPFRKGMPHKINLTGHNMAIMKTRHAELIASPDIQIFFEDINTLNVTGHVDIPKATIHLKPEHFGPCCSDDVVYLDTPKAKTNKLKIKPNLSLYLHPESYFMGYGFETNLSGQLSIQQNEAGRNEAAGSIHLHQGKYRFPGKTFTITQGQLYYPPGTSLGDPLLKANLVLPNRSEYQQRLSTEDTQPEGLTIQGRLLAPKISFIGQTNASAIGMADNALGQSLQTMAHAALFYNSRSGSILEGLDKKLNLSEIGIQKEESPQTINSDSDSNMFFVVGKKLSSRVYMQYKKSIDSKDNQIRLKYALGKHWDIGIEAGMGDNGTSSGADISFKLEKD